MSDSEKKKKLSDLIARAEAVAARTQDWRVNPPPGGIKSDEMFKDMVEGQNIMIEALKELSK